MIDSIPMLAFVRDNLDQIILGVAGLIVTVLLSALLESLRAVANRRRGGQS